MNLLVPITKIEGHTLHTLFMEGAQLMFQVRVDFCPEWLDGPFATERRLYWCNMTDLTVNATCAQMLYEYMQSKFGPSEKRARHYYTRGIVGGGPNGPKIGRALPRTAIYTVREPNPKEQFHVLLGAEVARTVPTNAGAGQHQVFQWGVSLACDHELAEADKETLVWQALMCFRAGQTMRDAG